MKSIEIEATTVKVPDDMEKGEVYYDVGEGVVKLAVLTQRPTIGTIILRDSIAFCMGAALTAFLIGFLAFFVGGWRP